MRETLGRVAVDMSEPGTKAHRNQQPGCSCTLRRRMLAASARSPPPDPDFPSHSQRGCPWRPSCGSRLPSPRHPIPARRPAGWAGAAGPAVAAAARVLGPAEGAGGAGAARPRVGAGRAAAGASATCCAAAWPRAHPGPGCRPCGPSGDRHPAHTADPRASRPVRGAPDPAHRAAPLGRHHVGRRVGRPACPHPHIAGSSPLRGACEAALARGRRTADVGLQCPGQLQPLVVQSVKVLHLGLGRKGALVGPGPDDGCPSFQQPAPHAPASTSRDSRMESA